MSPKTKKAEISGVGLILILILIGAGVYLYSTGFFNFDKTESVRTAQVNWLVQNLNWTQNYSEQVIDGYIYYVKFACNASGGEIIFKNADTFSIINQYGDYTGPDIGCRVGNITSRGELLADNIEWEMIIRAGAPEFICVKAWVEAEMSGANVNINQFPESICSSEFKTIMQKEVDYFNCSETISALFQQTLSVCYSIDYSKCTYPANGLAKRVLGSEMETPSFTLQDCINEANSTGSVPIIIYPTSSQLILIGKDYFSPGIGITGNYFISTNNGAYVSAVSPVMTAPGDNLKILAMNSGYHNTYLTYTIPNSPNSLLDVPLKKAAIVTPQIYDNFQILDSGNTVNLDANVNSNFALNVRLTGTSGQSSSDLICVLEADSTKISSMTLSGAGVNYLGEVKPSSHLLLMPSSKVWIYSLPSIEYAVLKYYNLNINSKAGMDASGTKWGISCYSKEYFLDSASGQVLYNIDDSQGTLKSLTKFAFTDTFN